MKLLIIQMKFLPKTITSVSLDLTNNDFSTFYNKNLSTKYKTIVYHLTEGQDLNLL